MLYYCAILNLYLPFSSIWLHCEGTYPFIDPVVQNNSHPHPLRWIFTDLVGVADTATRGGTLTGGSFPLRGCGAVLRKDTWATIFFGGILLAWILLGRILLGGGFRCGISYTSGTRCLSTITHAMGAMGTTTQGWRYVVPYDGRGGIEGLFATLREGAWLPIIF